ncbi:proline/betaine transporter [mine drainage metagenome]|uniref:Proline/betaine transporter n=1 Tax=mine drainage metagenome TaxID=410659 RepID=A0A1J5S292_9ZZZZ
MTAASAPLRSGRPLGRGDIKTLFLAALGGALEFYDFVIFVFFTAAIGKLFFPPDMPDWLRQLQAFGIFAAGYLARPLGGIVMAHFGDLLGRKRMFTLSVFLMAIPTLLVGLLPTYAVLGYGAPLLLLVMRILQGAAVGGEVPGAWVFVSEHVPERHVGLACGLLTGGLTSGILLGSLSATAVTVHYTPAEILAYAWRIPFLLGGLLGLLAVYLRTHLRETPVFLEISRMEQLAEEMPVKAVLRRHRRAIAVSVVATWMLTAAIVVMILITPTLLTRLFALPQAVVLPANSAATLALSVACLLVGMAADRFGPARVMLVGGVGLVASSYGLYHAAAAAPALLIPLYALTGFFVGTIAVVPVVMVRAFPPPVRFSGISLAYNLSYAVFGGLTPLAVPLLTGLSPIAPVHYVAAAVLAGILMLAWHGRRAGA